MYIYCDMQRRLPRGRQSVALSFSTHEGEITKASIFVARPLQSSHMDKRCGVQDTGEPQVKDDSSAPGPAGTLSGNCSGRSALRRER
jgi:hypothetical protein